MKKTVALFAVAGLAAATSEYQDDYLALRLARPHVDGVKTNTTLPIHKPLRPAVPTGMTRLPNDKLVRPTAGVKPTIKPKPTETAENSTLIKPTQPKLKPTLLQTQKDDEFYAEVDDEFYADEVDDEYYADDIYNDDALFAEDDFFAAKTDSKKIETPIFHTLPAYVHLKKPINSTLTAPKKTEAPVFHTLPAYVHLNSTAFPKPRPTTGHNLPRHTGKPVPRPIGKPVHKPEQKKNATETAVPVKDQVMTHRVPIKPIKPSEKKPEIKDVIALDDDEFWVDIDDEFYAEDDEFYAEDDEFYAEDDFFAAKTDSKKVETPILHTLPAYANLKKPINSTLTAPKKTEAPVFHTLPAYVHLNSTAFPKPRPTTGHDLPRHPSKPVPKPTGIYRPISWYKPAPNSINKPISKPEHKNATETKHTKPSAEKKPQIKDVIALDDDEFWVDIDDEFYAEDDEFYAEDDFFAAKTETKALKETPLQHLKDLLHNYKDTKNTTKPAVPVKEHKPTKLPIKPATDIKKPAAETKKPVTEVKKPEIKNVVALDDDEFWVEFDDFFAAKTETTKPKESTFQHLKGLLKGNRDTKDTLKNATKPATPIKEHTKPTKLPIKPTTETKPVVEKVKETPKEIIHPSAPRRFLSMF